MSSPSFKTDQKINEYQILEELGRGQQGVVYRVSKNGSEFALKLLIENEDQVASASRFRKEIAAFARLNHPSLVKVFDTGEHQGSPFFVMELVKGKTLSDHLKKGSLPLDFAMTIIKSLAEALCELQRCSLVHRDIKPENVIIKDDGQVKLIDLGFASGSEEIAQVSDQSVGTIAYCSPEQLGAGKQVVDERSDMYSLGITFYELLSGSHPFQSQNSAEMIQHHISTTPPSIASIHLQIPDNISRILDKLIKKNPAERYQTAKGFLRDLDRWTELSRLGEFDIWMPRTWEVPFIGRQNELSQLQKLWEDAKSGKGSSILIVGESGSGKSRLVQEIIKTVAVNPAELLLRGKFNSIDKGVPFSAIREAFDAYVEGFGKLSAEQKTIFNTELKTAAGEDLAMISQISRGLKEILNDHRDRSIELDSAERQDRFLRAVCDFIVNLSRSRKGLLITIDDIQWADEVSIEFLNRLSKAISNEKVLVLLTGRSEVENQAALNEIKNKMGRSLERIDLKTLDPFSLKTLIQTQLGKKEIEDSAIQKLIKLSNGNPLVVGEYLRSLLSLGHLRLVDDIWVLDEKGLSVVDLGANVYELILKRLSDIPKNELDTLSLLAVLGSRITKKIFLQVVGDVQVSEKVISSALQEGIFTESESGSYHFAHDKIQEALISRLDKEKFKKFNDRLAEVFSKLFQEQPDRIFDLARFYADGHWENPEKVFQLNFDAGLQAQSNYAFARSIQFFQTAQSAHLQFNSSSHQMQSLYRAMAMSCLSSGRLTEAHQAIKVAKELISDQNESVHLLYLETLAFASEGKLREAWRTFQASLDGSGSPYPKSSFFLALEIVTYLAFYFFSEISNVGYGFLSKFKKLTTMRTKFEMIYKIYESSYVTAYLLGRPIDLTLITLKMFFYGYFLGDTPEMGKARSAISLFWGLIRVRSLTNRNIRLGLSLAEKLNDKGLKTYVSVYGVTAQEFLGETLSSEKWGLEIQADVQRYLPTRLQSQYILEIGAKYLNRGQAKQCVDWLTHHFPTLERTNNKQMLGSALGILYSQHVVLGNVKEVREFHDRWITLINELDVPFLTANFHANNVAVLQESLEIGPAANQEIKSFFDLKIEDFHFTYPRCSAAMIFLWQLERIDPKNTVEVKKARQHLSSYLLGLNLRSANPIWRCLYLSVAAGLARFDGNLKKARKLLDKATIMAELADSLQGRLYVSIERIKLEKALGRQNEVTFEMKRIFQILIDKGCKLRLERIEKEFNVKVSDYLLPPATPGASTESANLVNEKSALMNEKIIKSLLKLSLSFSVSTDPREQILYALDEVVGLMGAEKAYVFLVDGEVLNFWGGRNYEQQVLQAPSGYSGTVINKVFTDGRPLVVTDLDQLEQMGSKSAIIHDLRSIICVPIYMKETLKGVIYADSRLSKGIFKEKDFEVMSAIGVQIAISLENVRIAKIEAEKRVIEKDLELSAAVQNYFLPKALQSSNSNIEVTTIYAPANQCGGDFWWHHSLSDSRCALFLGDVTGHGVGPAMITAMISSFFKFYSESASAFKIEEVMTRVSKNLFQLTNSTFLVSALGLELDTNSKKAKIHFAGGCEFFFIPKDGPLQLISQPSYLLGSEEYSPTVSEIDIAPGDRFFIYTDGITEMKTQTGRILGQRHIKKFLIEHRTMPSDQVLAVLKQHLDQLRSKSPQEDDFTFMMVEIKD